jgi:uncharacterized protein
MNKSNKVKALNSSKSKSANRIEIIDAIRGLAIFGILLANIRSWSGYRFIPFAEIEALPFYRLDALFNQLHYWLVDGKFYAIFSMLFGAGFGIQYLKNQQNQQEFIPRYRRRTFILLIFGLIHALIWSGDILTLYALLAFALIMLRNVDEQKLLPLAAFLLCAFSISQLYTLMYMQPDTEILSLAHTNYPELKPQEITAAFGNGSWADVFAINLHNLYWRWAEFFPNGRFSRVLGFFVLGFYLLRSGFFESGIYSARNLFLFAAIGSSATMMAWQTGTNISSWANSGSDIALKLVLVLGQIFLALTYICLLAQISKTSMGLLLTKILSLVGRMAFTSYIAQTLIGIGLFYGVGLGLWGSMGLAQLWLLALLVFGFQVLFCGLWLHFYRQGPLEWCWACLTNGKFQQNLRVRHRAH